MCELGVRRVEGRRPVADVKEAGQRRVLHEVRRERHVVPERVEGTHAAVQSIKRAVHRIDEGDRDGDSRQHDRRGALADADGRSLQGGRMPPPAHGAGRRRDDDESRDERPASERVDRPDEFAHDDEDRDAEYRLGEPGRRARPRREEEPPQCVRRHGKRTECDGEERDGHARSLNAAVRSACDNARQPTVTHGRQRSLAEHNKRNGRAAFHQVSSTRTWCEAGRQGRGRTADFRFSGASM